VSSEAFDRLQKAVVIFLQQQGSAFQTQLQPNTGSSDSTTNMNSSSGKSKSSCQLLIKLSIQQVSTGGNLEMGLLMLRVLQH